MEKYGTFNKNCVFKWSASMCQIQGSKFKQPGEGFCSDTWDTGAAVLGRLLISETNHWTLNFFLSPLNLCTRGPHRSTPPTPWKLAFPSPYLALPSLPLTSSLLWIPISFTLPGAPKSKQPWCLNSVTRCSYTGHQRPDQGPQQWA